MSPINESCHCHIWIISQNQWCHWFYDSCHYHVRITVRLFRLGSMSRLWMSHVTTTYEQAVRPNGTTVYELTDPVIHKKRSKRLKTWTFGRTDRGKKGTWHNLCKSDSCTRDPWTCDWWISDFFISSIPFDFSIVTKPLHSARSALFSCKKIPMFRDVWGKKVYDLCMRVLFYLDLR